MNPVALIIWKADFEMLAKLNRLEGISFLYRSSVRPQVSIPRSGNEPIGRRCNWTRTNPHSGALRLPQKISAPELSQGYEALNLTRAKSIADFNLCMLYITVALTSTLLGKIGK